MSHSKKCSFLSQSVLFCNFILTIIKNKILDSLLFTNKLWSSTRSIKEVLIIFGDFFEHLKGRKNEEDKTATPKVAKICCHSEATYISYKQEPFSKIVPTVRTVAQCALIIAEHSHWFEKKNYNAANTLIFSFSLLFNRKGLNRRRAENDGSWRYGD